MIKFLKNLLAKIGLTDSQKKDYIVLHVKDDNCENINEVRAIKTYDLHRIYGDELPGDYRLKKVVVCNECYSKIYIEVCFDNNYEIVYSESEGGEIFRENKLDK